MQNIIINMLTISEQLNNLNQKFNAWTDKFTSNSLIASFLTLGLFVIICIIISNFANK